MYGLRDMAAKDGVWNHQSFPFGACFTRVGILLFSRFRQNEGSEGTSGLDRGIFFLLMVYWVFFVLHDGIMASWPDDLMARDGLGHRRIRWKGPDKGTGYIQSVSRREIRNCFTRNRLSTRVCSMFWGKEETPRSTGNQTNTYQIVAHVTAGRFRNCKQFFFCHYTRRFLSDKKFATTPAFDDTGDRCEMMRPSREEPMNWFAFEKSKRSGHVARKNCGNF